MGKWGIALQREPSQLRREPCSEIKSCLENQSREGVAKNERLLHKKCIHTLNIDPLEV
jgi:hypothetical protein